MKKEKEPIAKPISLSDYWNLIAEATLSFKGKPGSRVVTTSGRPSK